MSDNLKNLEIQLELQEWPSVYLFKFIIPNSPEKIAQLSAIFDEGTDLRIQPSKNGKYVSVSSKELMLDVKTIIDKYKKAALIEGVIAL